MELVLSRKKNNVWVKTIVIAMIAVCLVYIVPTSLVLAGYWNDPTVGMFGVNNPDLTVGMTGVDNPDLLVEVRDFSLIYPDTAGYGLFIIIPLIFLAVAVLLLMNLVLSEEKDIKHLIYAAILIYVAISMLQSVQFNINSLLGG